MSLEYVIFHENCSRISAILHQAQQCLIYFLEVDAGKYFPVGYSKYIISQLTNYALNKFHGGSYCIHSSPSLGPTHSPTNRSFTVLKTGPTDGRYIAAGPRYHSFTCFWVPQDSWRILLVPHLEHPFLYISHLHLVLQSGLFLLDFQTYICMQRMRATCVYHIILLHLINLVISDEHKLQKSIFCKFLQPAAAVSS